ncbi:MAG: hypothetical protein IPM92_04180 [Saprospiraceae bacterium]|nr:hypothetical protein [Saprospiraceae bacterium]
MENINLSFTEDQFKSLTRLVFLGKWMLESNHVDFEEKFKVEQDVEQIIFKNCDENVCEYSEEDAQFYPTITFEDEMHILIEYYDQDTFWQELPEKLAFRDLYLKMGTKLDVMTAEEKFLKLSEYMELYMDEFDKNELNNLVIQ